MSIKIFNYTNDKYLQNIYGEDIRSEISAIIGNKGYAFMGIIEQDNDFNTYVVKKGSIIFSGGLCIRVLEDEKIDMTNNKYIVLETSYDPATKNCSCYGEVKDAIYNSSTESYTCIIKGVETLLDETIQGSIKKQFLIYDKEKNKIALGLSADSIGEISLEELERKLNEFEELKECDQNKEYKTCSYNGNEKFAKAALMKSPEEKIGYSYISYFGDIIWSSSWSTDNYKWLMFQADGINIIRSIKNNSTSTTGYSMDDLRLSRFGVTEGKMVGVPFIQSTIYTFGGILPDNTYSNALLMLDLNINGRWQWNTKAVGPKALADTFIWRHAELNRVYIIGGTDESGDITNNFMYYDENSEEFIELPSMIHPRRNFGFYFHKDSGGSGDYIYIFGGENNSGPIEYCEKYSFKTNSWTSISNMPIARTGIEANFSNSYDGMKESLFFIGGANTREVDAYSVTGDFWYKCAPIPVDVMNAISCIAKDNYGEIIYLKADNLNYLYFFDIANNNWCQKPLELPKKIIGGYLFTVLFENKIEVRLWGGKTSTGAWNNYLIRYTNGLNPWCSKVYEAKAGSLISIDGEVIIDYIDGKTIYNLETCDWTIIPKDAWIFGIPGIQAQVAVQKSYDKWIE